MVNSTTDLMEFQKGSTARVAPRRRIRARRGAEAANKDLAQRPGGRRAIVSVNLEPSNEQSIENASRSWTPRKSGAQLWAVSIHRGKLQNSKRDVVLNDFSKVSGGQRDFIVGIRRRRDSEGLRGRVGLSVKSFTSGESNKETKVIQMGTARQGVKLHASGFPPK